MVAPLLPAASSQLSPPSSTVVKQPTDGAPSLLNFPNEFPYEFEDSPFQEDLTETEDETTDDEDDFLAGLTRRLALSTQRLPSYSLFTDKTELKPKVTELKQSGLVSPNGPFSQVPSPPTSPFREEDSLKVISAVAGEVAKIKMADFDSESSKSISRPNLNINPNSVIPFHQNAAFCDNYYWLRQPQYHHQSSRRIPIPWLSSPSSVNGVYHPPTAVKTPSAGTGVFLPRKYSIPSEPRKKSGGCVKIPTKVVKQQNPKIEEISGRCQPKSQPCLSKGHNNVGGGCLKQEKPLPQEWMY